jgi:UrcA family protein
MRITIPTVAMIFAFCAFQANAHADALQTPSTQTRFEISYADLNLNYERDARVMLGRIERAAKKACGGHASFSSYTGGLEASFYECRDNAIRQAVQLLSAPVVTRLYHEASQSTTAQHGISTVRHAKTHSTSDPLYFAE